MSSFDTAVSRYYTSRKAWQDGTSEFWAMIQSAVPVASRVLEVGPGPANRTSAFLRSIYGSLDGLDVDPDVKRNESLDNRFVYDGSKWPLSSGAYDLIIADYVLEHIANPEQFSSELARVLTPGGSFIFRTPNLLHYVSLGSWATSHRIHIALANRLRGRSLAAHDPYPTFYRMNLPGSLRRLLGSVGLEQVELRFVEKEPSYGASSMMLFYLFMGYERVVNASSCLQVFRANLFGRYKKLRGRAPRASVPE